MIRFALSFLLFAVFSAQAQDIVPQNYALKTKEDYQRYEQNVKDGIKWLSATPRSEYPSKRAIVEDFLTKWIEGTPYLTVIVEPFASQLAKRNPDLLVSFILGYTDYQLVHPDNKMLLNPNISGVESLILDYKTNPGTFRKDEKIEEILELQKKGEINAWVKNQLIQQELPN